MSSEKEKKINYPGSDQENTGPHNILNINIYIIEYRDELIQTKTNETTKKKKNPKTPATTAKVSHANNSTSNTQSLMATQHTETQKKDTCQQISQIQTSTAKVCDQCAVQWFSEQNKYPPKVINHYKQECKMEHINR